MPKLFIFVCLFCLVICSNDLQAKWQIEKTSWLNDDYLTLVRTGNEANTALFLSTNNMENYQFHLLLNEGTIEKAGNDNPFIIKGEVYFDNKKYGTYELKNSLNVNKFKGVDYEFGEDFLDAEVYEKLKHAKQFSFHYRGKRGKSFQVTVLLGDYYTQFNRFTTQRMYEIVPSFLDYYGKKKYRQLVGRCIATAEGQVEDIRSKNNGTDKNTRVNQVIKRYKNLKAEDRDFEFSEQQLTDRIRRAYEFYGDTNVPEWLLYPFFSQCYNKEIDNFSA